MRILAGMIGLALTATASLAKPVAIDPARIGRHIEILASNGFAGRFPGSPGETLTTDYIVRQFAAIGLKPGGDIVAGKRTWLQKVPMLTVTLVGTPIVTLTTPQGTEPWLAGQQITVRPNLARPGVVDIAAAPLVFVGYGVVAPEKNWDDYKDIDLTGKIAVILGNDPDSEGGEGDFGGKAVTSYGFGQHKVEQAVQRGAIGVLFVHDPGLTGYGWATIANSDARPKLDIERSPPRVRALYDGFIDMPVISDIFRRAGSTSPSPRPPPRPAPFVR